MQSALKLPFRPDIQGLRAISIGFVVLNHTGIQFFSGGFIGVDVFFVLSGYLITGLLIQEHSSYGKINMLKFYARRLKRLLPALFCMLAISVLCASVLLSDYELTQQLASICFAATWTSNLFFSFTTAGYFAELRNKDIFLHTWSLGVEEQFYLVWPVLIALSFLLGKKIGGSQVLSFVAILVLSSLCSFGLSEYWTISNPIFAFYMMPSRIWQFALGAFVYIWAGRNKNNVVNRHPLTLMFIRKGYLGLFGIGLIFGSAVFFHSNMPYPGVWAVLPSMGALLLIGAGLLDSSNSISRVLAHPSLVWIGDRSYSWYLWHWPVLMIGASVGMRWRADTAAGLVVLSLFIAMLSYRFVELPFWKGKFSNISHTRVILLSLLAMLILIWASQNHLRSVQVRSEGQAASFVNRARSDFPIIYGMGCDAWYANANVQPCIFGDNNYQKTVVLMGDSVAGQWFSLLPEIFRSPVWRTIVLTKSSCPMVDEDFFYARIGKIYTVCNEWRDAVIEYLNSIQPDIVFLGNTAANNFSETQWVEGSERVFLRLSKIAKQVIVLPGTYALSFDGPSCLEHNLPSLLSNKEGSPHICAEQVSNAEQVGKVVGYLERAANRFSNVNLLNLNDLLCPSGICSALGVEDLVVFRDSQHLTDKFVRRQVPIVRERLKVLGIEVSS